MNLGKVGVFAGALTLAGCTDTSTLLNRANEYMADKPRTQVEEVIAPINFPHPVVGYAECQSKLDSVAYRDLFETTSKKNDSTVVAEFNKIAANNRMTDPRKCEQTLIKSGISNKEYNQAIDKASGMFVAPSLQVEYIQHKADSVAYDKFFRKHNLLDDAMAKKIMQVTKKIAPKL